MGSRSSETGASARRVDGAADSRGPHVREKGGARTQDERGAGELGLGRLAGLRRWESARERCWAAGKGERERDGPREGLGRPEHGKGREEGWAGLWVGLVLLGWVGFGWVFFLSLFFFLSTQNYLNSNEFEFKLLYNQTK